MKIKDSGPLLFLAFLVLCVTVTDLFAPRAHGGGAGDASSLVGAIATAAAPIYLEGKKHAVSQDLSGNLRTTGTATISGGVIDVEERDVYHEADGTELAIKFAKLDLASATTTEIVPEVPTKTLVIVGFKISPSADADFKWVTDSGGAATVLNSLTFLSARGGYTAGYPEGRPVRIFAGADGKNLAIDSTTADPAGIDVYYVEAED